MAEQVVVVTGASSGIGRATARYLAARGARVVVTARRGEALDELVREIEADGGEAVAVPADVTREDELRAVARAAVERWGRIDTWVNDAGVMVHGRVGDIPVEEVRRQLDVNVVGVVSGTRCALDVMLPQGRGVIVQVASIAALHGAPYLSVYSASKAAVVAFTEALRSELWGSGVALSVVFPPPVDTPIFHHGRARLGVQPKPSPLMAYPEEIARTIARLAETGARSGYPTWTRAFAVGSAVAPSFMAWFLHHIRAGNWADQPPGEYDNLDTPAASPAVERVGWADVGWRGLTLREAVRVVPWETLLGAAALGALAAVAAGRPQGRA